MGKEENEKRTTRDLRVELVAASSKISLRPDPPAVEGARRAVVTSKDSERTANLSAMVGRVESGWI